MNQAITNPSIIKERYAGYYGLDTDVTPAIPMTGNLSWTAAGWVKSGGGLVPNAYDYISLGYTGTNLTSVVYKSGGSAGTTVATLTLAYTGSDLTSVTKT